MYIALDGCDHCSVLFAFKTNLFIEKYIQFFSGVSFFRWYYFLLNLCTSRRKSWLLKKSGFKVIVWLFKMHANFELTNEISSFVIYYWNKELSNQRPFHKSVKNPCDQNKESSSNTQTFSHTLRLYTGYSNFDLKSF